MRINRVSYKIFLGFLSLSSVILIVMTVVVKTSYARSLRRNEINSLMLASSRTREQFDFIMGIIDDTARAIGSRPEVLAALTSTTEPPGAGDFSMTVYLQSLREIQPFLGNISIVGAGGQFCSSHLALKRAYFEALYQRYERFFNAGMIYKDYFVDTWNFDFVPPYTLKDILTGVWPVYNIREEKLIGQIYLGLNYSIFQEMFILSPTINNEKILIIDPEGKIIYHYPSFISFDSVLTG